MADVYKMKFVNTSAEAKKTLQGLSKTALRDAGKIVRKTLRDTIPVRSKRFKNHIASWAFIDKKTGQPQLQVGFYSWQRVRKRGKLPSHANPHWIEFGVKAHNIKTGNYTSKKLMVYADDIYGKSVDHPGTPALHVLRNSVYNNIDKIRDAQQDLLKYLDQTIEVANSKVFNSEEPEDD